MLVIVALYRYMFLFVSGWVVDHVLVHKEGVE
jgi:hypothetical protein